MSEETRVRDAEWCDEQADLVLSGRGGYLDPEAMQIAADQHRRIGTALRNFTAWQHAADKRWRQLTALRERVAARLLRIDTLARNVEEYPDRIPMLIEAIEQLQHENYTGRLAQISGDGALQDQWTVENGSPE